MNNLSEEIIASLRAQCKAYFYQVLSLSSIDVSPGIVKNYI